MPSERLIEHFRNPRNVGELPPPALKVDVVNPACGDMLRLCARIEGDARCRRHLQGARLCRLDRRGVGFDRVAAGANTAIVVGVEAG